MSLLRNLDLNLLVIFEAIYTAGNVTHAAKALGVTQPTISNALTRLREALDDSLFVREGRGVKPTPKAMEMIGPVREALQMIETGVGIDEEFDPASSQRHFRIVMMDHLEPVLMPHLIRAVQDFKSVTFEALPLYGTEVADRLNDGSLDLVFSPFVPGAEDVRSEPIGNARIVMIAREDHPQIDKEITLEQFGKIGQVALIPTLRAISRIDEELRHRELERHIVYCVTKFWSFAHTVATTDLIGVVPGGFAEAAAKHFPLTIHKMPFEVPEQQVYMIWKKNRSNDPGHRWLRDEIRSVYRASASVT